MTESVEKPKSILDRMKARQEPKPASEQKPAKKVEPVAEKPKEKPKPKSAPPKPAPTRESDLQRAAESRAIVQSLIVQGANEFDEAMIHKIGTACGRYINFKNLVGIRWNEDGTPKPTADVKEKP